MENRTSTRLPTRSRLPTASTSLAASTSTSLPSATKRTASTAQLEGDIEHALTRRKAKLESFSASMTKNSLERRAADAEQAKRMLEADLVKLKQEKDKVERDRRWFAQREKEINEERELERAAFDKERNELTAEVKEARTALDNMQRHFDSLSEAHDEMERAAGKANRVSEDTQAQLIATQEQNEYHHAEAAKWRQLAQEREEALEALKLSSRSGRALPVSTSGEAARDSKEWDTLRSQLVQQTEQMRRLEDVNSKMKAELLVMKERYTNVEVLREEKRVLERRVRDADSLREQLGLMEAQVDALRQEREKSTAHAQRASDVPVAVTQELTKLRMDYADLLGQHQSQTNTLTRKDDEFQRTEALLTEARNEVDDLRLRLQISEATNARTEKRAKTAQQEVELLNSLLEKFTNQEEADESVDRTEDMTERSGMRIAALETLIEELKEANAALAAEMDSLGGDASSVMRGPGRGSISALREALAQSQEQHAQALEDLESAKADIKELETKSEKLDEELFRLKGEVGAGRIVPSGVRVLEMRDNPAAKWFGKREEDVQRLKKENEVLRSMLGDGVAPASAAGGMEGLVPKASLDVVLQEKEELQATIKEKEKRLLRLQQIFSLKAEEFKTTVTSLLGWKFRFQQNGAVQLTSVYDPNALIVFSQPTKSKRTVGAGPLEGEDIKVQLIAESAPLEVGELYRTWVAGFGCVPGFLGSLSVQLWEASPEGAAKLKGGT